MYKSNNAVNYLWSELIDPVARREWNGRGLTGSEAQYMLGFEP